MTYNADFVIDKKTANIEEILCANNEKIKVKSVGNGTLNLETGNIPIENVLHVPELGVNLLSVYRIVDKGNTIIYNQKSR